MNASLAKYHVPVHMDVPEIEVMWTDVPNPRLRDLPITLDKLL